MHVGIQRAILHNGLAARRMDSYRCQAPAAGRLLGAPVRPARCTSHRGLTRPATPSGLYTFTLSPPCPLPCVTPHLGEYINERAGPHLSLSSSTPFSPPLPPITTYIHTSGPAYREQHSTALPTATTLQQQSHVDLCTFMPFLNLIYLYTYIQSLAESLTRPQSCCDDGPYPDSETECIRCMMSRGD